MMKKLAYSISVAVALLTVGVIGAQTKSDPNPKTGYQPAGVYSLSEIESISQTSGNLMLRIPLGSLGPDRVGNSHGLALTYNSKIWESATVQVNQTPARGIQAANPLAGGWHYELAYDLEVSLRSDDFSECNSDQPPTSQPFIWAYKTHVVFPDGSRHLLRLKGDADLNGDGFYRVSPAGEVNSCPLPTLAPATRTYYTTDGTFARLTVKSNPAGQMSWKLSFRSGDYVLGGYDDTFQYRDQAICDRNGNCAYLAQQFNAAVSGHGSAYFATLRDEFDDPRRTIQITYGGGTDLHTGPDTIVVPGFNGAPMQWTVSWGGASSPIGYYTCDPIGSFVTLDPCPQPTNPGGVTAIQPPVQSGLSSYQFTYGAKWGELSSIQLPSGAKATYKYWLDPNSDSATECGKPTLAQPVWYDILGNYPCKKAVFWTASSQSADEVSRMFMHPTDAGSYDYSQFTGPDGGVTKTTFNPFSYWITHSAGDWQSGLVTSIENPDGSSITKAWDQNKLPNMSLPYDSQNVYVTTETRSVPKTGGAQVSQTTYTVDQNGNTLTATVQPDWNSAATRTTEFSYINSTPAASSAPADVANLYWKDSAPALLSFPSTRKLYDSLATAAEQFCYDGKGNVRIHARLASGSATTLVNCQSNTVQSYAIATKHRYGANGEPLVTMDANGKTTRLVYDSSRLYATEKDDACQSVAAATQDPDALDTGACTLPEARHTALVTDFTTGKIRAIRDLDNQTSATTDYDVFGRATRIADPVGAVTTITYNDVQRWQKTSAPLDASRQLVSAVCVDSMGRVITRQSSNNGQLTPCSQTTNVTGATLSYQYVTNATDASQNGRYEWVSNPTGGASQSADGWTRLHYDMAGRLVEEATFSGTAQPSYNSTANSTGRVAYSYDGPCQTVNDQAETASAGTGMVKKSCTDAVGRVSRVDETANAATYTTTYQYNVLDNLTKVFQGAQTRTFEYDPLGRLTKAQNPEMGDIEYSVYDANGNLTEKKDQRLVNGNKVTTSLAYDGLNRLRTKTYNDGTPSVTYTYDQDLSGGGANYARGRLSSVAAPGGTVVEYNRYDAAGRVLAHTQKTADVPYQFAYSYNVAGLLTKEVYPSGRTIVTEYDGAGRPIGLKGGPVDGSSLSYYVGGAAGGGQEMQYWAHGGLRQMVLRNNLTEQWDYNSRLQPTAMTLGSVRSLSFGYGTAASANNGNMRSQVISGAGLSTAVTQSYGYDRVNRISSAGEGSVWTRGFDYDQYGNGWVTTATGIQPTASTPQSSTAYSEGGVNRNHLIINNAHYDDAGNLDQLGGAYTFKYDAENRMKQSTLTVATMYEYDGDGRRVAKVMCPDANPCTASTTGAKATWYVYDAQGEVVAEYSNQSATSSSCSPCFVTVDHLGSTRVVTNSVGTALECHDYLPFGDEILADTGGRTGCYPAPPPALLPRGWLFTGKERDGETQSSTLPSGLDNFGARYYAAAMGRFTSPDALFYDQHPTDPQSWNLYAYARNNPFRFLDPTGRDCVSTDGGKTFHDENDGESTCATAVTPQFAATAVDDTITNPFFFAVAQGTNNAAPVVNALGNTLVTGAEFATGVPISLIADLTSQSSEAATNSEAAMAGIVMRNPADIRFTQDTVSATFGDGRPVTDTVNALRNGTLKPEDIKAIRTFEKDGVTWTLDNRRLLTGILAETDIATRPATARQIAREVAKKMTTVTEGRFVSVIRGMVKVIR